MVKCRIEEIDEILRCMDVDCIQDAVSDEAFNYHRDRLVNVVNELVERLAHSEYERFYGGK